LALAISVGWGAACGGSSSETPPPLEPDPKRLVAAPVESEAAATPAAPGANSDALQHPTEPYSGDGAEFGLEAEVVPGSAAGENPTLQTWGSGGKVPPLSAGRPRPAAAPPR
jgi:hypothetical protein